MKSSVKSARMVRKKMRRCSVSCAMYFCAGCQRAHKKPRATAGHEFVSVEKALKEKLNGPVVPCEKHPHAEISTYCRTDKQIICLECVVDFHKGHEVDRLVNVVQGFKEEMSLLVEKVCLSVISVLLSPRPSFLFQFMVEWVG